MSEVSFRIGTDITDFKSGLSACAKGIDSLSAQTQSFENTAKDSFSAPTKEVSNLNNEIHKGAKQVNEFIKETNKLSTSGNAVKELKKQIKEYTAEAYKAGAGTEAFTKNLQKAGQLKDELADLNAQVKALSGNIGENLAKAAGNSLSLISRGFEGVSSVSILAGTNTKEFEKTLLQLQAFNGLANVAHEFAGIGDRITEIKEGFKPVANLFTSGASSIVSGYGSANESLKGFFSNFTSNAKGAFKNGVSFIKDFGSNAVSIAKSAGTGFVSFFSNFGTNMKGFATAAKSGINTVGTAIKANPLGVILTVITLVIAVFIALKDKVKPIAELFSLIGDAIDYVSNKIEAFAQMLGLVDDENEKRAKKTIENSQKEIDAIKSKYDFEIAVARAAGKETIKAELEKSKAVKDRAKETILQLEKLRATEGKLTDEQVKQFDEAQKEMSDSMKEGILAQVSYEREQRDKKAEADKKAQELSKQRQEKAKADAEKYAKELSDALIDLAKKSNQAELNALTGQEKLDKIRENNLAEFELLRGALEKKGKLTDKNFKFTQEQEAELASIKTEIEREYYANSLNLQVEFSNKQAQLQKSKVDNELAVLELRNSIAKNNIEKTRAIEGASEADKLIFEEEKNKTLLNLEYKFQQDKLQLVLAEIDAETNIKKLALNNELNQLSGKNDAISKLRVEAINTELSQLSLNSELVKQQAITSTDNILAGISDSLNKTKPKNKINISKLLNLDDTEIATALNINFNAKVKPEDISNAKQALQQMAQALQQIMSAYFEEEQRKLDKELDDNQKRIDARDENIASLQESLEIEKSLQDQGLANNVDRIQSAIDEQEKARQRDLENEKRIKEEKKKLAKQQLLIDSLTQGSQMALAISQLYGALSGFVVGPVPVGLIVATGAAVAMVSAFAAQKAQALDAINKGDAQFYTGGYTGDGNKYDERGTVHAGEYVINKEKTKKNFNLLDGLHKDDDRLIMAGIQDLIKDKGISLIQDIPNELGTKKDSIRSNETKMFINNNSGVESRIDMLEVHLRNLVKQGNYGETVLNDGSVLIKKGNITSKIKTNR